MSITELEIFLQECADNSIEIPNGLAAVIKGSDYDEKVPKAMQNFLCVDYTVEPKFSEPITVKLYRER